MNGTCPATCQLNETQPLYLRRTRQCANATLTENCNGASLEELVVCSFQVPCPGIFEKVFLDKTLQQNTTWFSFAKLLYILLSLEYCGMHYSNIKLNTAWKLSVFGVFLVRIRKNTDQKKLKIQTLFTQWKDFRINAAVSYQFGFLNNKHHSWYSLFVKSSSPVGWKCLAKHYQ